METEKLQKIDLTVEQESMNTMFEKALFNPDNVSLFLRICRLLLSLLAIGLAVYMFKYAARGGLPSWQHRAVFTSVMLILCFAYIPFRFRGKKMHWLFNVVPLALSIWVLVYVFIAFPAISWRQGNASQTDMIMATILVFLVIEGVRRTVGSAMAFVTLFFWVYIFIGPWFPGLLAHPGFTYRKMTDTMFITTNGIFTTPIYIAASVLILFLIFCSLLLKTGAAQLFIELAFAVTGTKRGGPAQAAVLSSALMATITGNGAANATMTGSFTIPLMKKVGYKREFAGAVEAVASQGGQIMPPVMGAAAFIMAEYTGIPFIKIAGYAFVPACLYFVVAGVVIYLQAKRQGLEGLAREQLPDFWQVMKKRGYLLIPMFIIVFVMVRGYSPMMAGFWAINSVLFLSLLKKETRMSFVGFLAALEESMQGAIGTVMACAGAGIITGAVIMTGLGIRFSRLAIQLSGGELLPMLLMIMLASIILGMGMPTVSAYVILATVAVGALIRIGVPVLAAHFFVFYFGIFSGITPPVAITAYITAGIAGANPLKTAWQSMRIGAAAFILPYMMVYNPALLLSGTLLSIVTGILTAFVGLVAFAAFIQGYLITAASWWQRIMLLISAFSLVYLGGLTDAAGFAVLAVVVIIQLNTLNKQKKAEVPKTAGMGK
ncbi:MAG: TRAP transporter permease [Dethiobacter sp.]|jgi:TRAP transporter 4TM/12TM fusion protein|nr:TRAP transporter permease [Dethiobacter sp.]